MPIRYMRVKDKRTKHEYDVLVDAFDPSKHDRVTRPHYRDVVSRPRPPKPFVRKGGKAAPPRNGDIESPDEPTAPEGDTAP